MFAKVSYNTCLAWELFNTAQNVAEAVSCFLQRSGKFKAQKESPEHSHFSGFPNAPWPVQKDYETILEPCRGVCVCAFTGCFRATNPGPSLTGSA